MLNKKLLFLVTIISCLFFVFYAITTIAVNKINSPSVMKTRPMMKKKFIGIKKKFTPIISKGDVSLKLILIQPPITNDKILSGSVGDLNGNDKSEIIISTHMSIGEGEEWIDKLFTYEWDEGGYSLQWSKNNNELGVLFFWDNVIGDIDGDKKAEFILLTDNGHCIFKNNGSFYCTKNEKLYEFVAIGDIDNDGKSEVIVRDIKGNIMLHILKYSNTTFNEISTMPGFFSSVGDVDNDGKNELISITFKRTFNSNDIKDFYEDNDISIYKWKNGALQETNKKLRKLSGGQNKYLGFYFANMYGKGKKDIIANSMTYIEPKNNQENLVENWFGTLDTNSFEISNQGPKWRTSISSKGYIIDTINVADLDGDKKDEIIVALWDDQEDAGHIKVFGLKGNFFYERADLKEKDAGFRIIGVGDTDGDGKDEVVLRRNYDSILVLSGK